MTGREGRGEARPGQLGLQGWEGLTWTDVEVVGETPKRYRIRAITRTRLAGMYRWLEPGKVALVPKHAVKFRATAGSTP